MEWDHLSSRVSSAELVRNFAAWQDKARVEPVVVTHHGRPRVVLVSAETYAGSMLRSGASPLNRDAGQRRFNALINHLGSAFVALDTELRILAVNPVFERATEMRGVDIVGLPWAEVFNQRGAMIAEQLRRVLRTGEPNLFTVQSALHPGRQYTFRAFAYPDGVATLVRNSTEDSLRAMAADDSRALRSALDIISGVGVARLNVRGVITDVSVGFTRMTGFSLEDLGGARLTDLVRPRDRPELSRRVEKCLLGGEVERSVCSVLTKAHEETSLEFALAPVGVGLAPEAVMAVLKAV